MNGAHLLVQSLEQHGVEVVFGYPGGSVLDVYDALLGSRVRHVMTRHEQAAAHSADGYARVTGRTGVCIATSGPGATNLVTGLMTAYMDSVPLVVFTGQVPSESLGTDAFQEADITGITLPAVKHSYLVQDVRSLERIVSEAFLIAASGRPGPVLVDLPRDVLAAPMPETAEPGEPRLPGYRPPRRGHPGHPLQVRRAVEAIAASSRPVVLAGGGVITSGGAEELQAFATRLGLPVTSTLMGLGAFPGDHQLWLGMAGMHGTWVANQALRESDLVLAVGVRFDDRLTGNRETFLPQATVIHVDIDAAEIGKNITVDIPIVGDARPVLAALRDQWEAQADVGGAAPDWGRWCRSLRAREPEQGPALPSCPGRIHPPAVITALWELCRGRALLATDVGQHQMWVAQYYPFLRPRTLLSSGGLGTMGFGLPAAIGAKLALPEQPVVLVTGDGSLLMNCQELATLAEQRLAVKILLFNNGCLGMVRQWQELFYAGRYSSIRLAGPDFVRLADAFGVPARRAAAPDAVREALGWLLDEPGPGLLECVVAPEENVWPIIPPGRDVRDIITGPAPGRKE